MRADRPSTTAALVAAGTIFVARDARLGHLVPEGAEAWSARCLHAASAPRLVAARALSHRALRWAPRLAERLTVPGLLLHFALRKRWIEEAVRAQIARGCEQVVVIGAGFDTLGLRLGPEFSHVGFIEIDHPATQAAKQRALAHGAAPANLHLVTADLARVDLAHAVDDAPAYRRDAPSVFVLEGVLMYLAPADVDAVFAALRTLQPRAGAVVFTVMEPAADGVARFHDATPLVRRLLGARNEPFTSTLPRDDVERFVGRWGLRLDALADSAVLRARYLSPPGRPAVARGELLVLATR